jgi:hypothetical protein
MIETEQTEWTVEDKKSIPPLYGCEILLENTTLELAKDPLFPTDAYIVIYKINDKCQIDLCRGTRVGIFDMYYDKFGPSSIQKIDWANGKINPNLWGQKPVPKNKKRK